MLILYILHVSLGPEGTENSRKLLECKFIQQITFHFFPELFGPVLYAPASRRVDLHTCIQVGSLIAECRKFPVKQSKIEVV